MVEAETGGRYVNEKVEKTSIHKLFHCTHFKFIDTVP